MRRTLFAVSLYTLTLVTWLAPARAQSERLTDQSTWQGLSPAAFLESPGTADSSAARDHAWSAYLDDPSFVSSEDWRVVSQMVERFAIDSGQLAEGVSDAQQARLKERISDRLRTDTSIVSGVDIFELGKATGALGPIGLTSADTANAFALWMGANEWRHLELAPLYNLFSWVNADAVDRRSFSVRWRGFLTAPRTGEYTFRQIQQYNGTNSRLLVQLDGASVLDSRDKSAGAGRFQSQPIRLISGSPAALRVDMVHEVSRIDYSEGAPMVVLTWEGPGAPERIIPAGAYSKEASRGKRSRGALIGEYFADTSFRDLRVTRDDPGLSFVSSWPPAAPTHHDKAAEVFARCKQMVLSNAYLAEAMKRGDSEVFTYLLWRIAYRMNAYDRQQLVANLRRSPQLLAQLTPQTIARLYQAIYFLPSGDQVDLLGEWAASRPQPHCRPGPFPGWSDGSYQQLNTDFYWLIGKFLQGPYTDNAERLLSDYLVRSDGECCLPIAYVLAFSGKERSMQRDLVSRVEEMLDDETKSGDQRVTWLIAKAFCRGIPPIGGAPRPLRGMGELQEATLVADSDPYKCWAVEEILARAAAVGKSELARQLASEHEVLLRGSDTPGIRGGWPAVIAALEERYARRALEQADESQRAYTAELARRREAAEERGNAVSAASYAKRLEALD